MAMSGSHLSSTLFALISSRGNKGPDLKNFTDVIGDGIVNASIGAPFTTTDAGSGKGGSGTGTGITLTPGLIAPLIYSTAVSKFGGSGPELLTMCQDIETAVIGEFALASLESDHPGVGVGAGTIVGGLPTINAALLTPSIFGQGVGKKFLGVDWMNMANAIATGVAAAMPTAAGAVVISGSGGDPAGGTGTGTIS